MPTTVAAAIVAAAVRAMVGGLRPGGSMMIESRVVGTATSGGAPGVGRRPRQFALCLSLALASASVVCVAAPRNLAVNGGFEQELSGWQRRALQGAVPTACEIDVTDKRSGGASLCVPGNGAKAGAFQRAADIPALRALRFRYWGKVEKSPELSGGSALVGGDLGIVLDDGKTVWFMPESLRLGPREAGRWVEKCSFYAAPGGRRITAISIHCLNYSNSGRAWFDDVEVTPIATPTGKVEADVCFVLPLTDRGEEVREQLRPKIESAGRPAAVVPPMSELGAGRLLVLTEFPDDPGYYRWIRDYCYVDGGAVIACGLPNNRCADGIRRFIWGERRPARTVATPDGRAVYYPTPASAPDDMKPVLDRALAAPEALPEELEAVAFPESRQAEIREACLWLDGRPCLLRAMGAYILSKAENWEQDLADYGDMGLNGIVVYLEPDLPEADFVRFLDTAERNGLQVIVWFRVSRPVRESGGLPWRWEWLEKFLRRRQHPALLSWLMSDDTSDKHYPVIRKIHSLIKRFDKDNFTTATCFGFRRPDMIGAERWTDWQRLMDYPTTYDYPLNKENKHFRANLCVGLEDIQKLAENVNSVYGEETYFHLWAQSHLQTHVRRKLHLGAADEFLTSPEQTRLLTFMMVSAGTRGILYFHAGAFRDVRLGVGRRNELALVWDELGAFEDLLAAGKRGAALSTSRADVEAMSFSKGGETLLLLIKHGEQYHRYVADGVVEDLEVKVRVGAAAGLKAWSVAGPEVREVEARAEEDDVLALRVDRFDLTDVVLIAPKPDRAAATTDLRRERAPRVAERACNVARDKMTKTEVVAKMIASAGGAIPDQATALLAEAERQLAEAESRLAGDDPVGSHRSSRAVLVTCRRIRETLIAEAKSSWAKQDSPPAPELFLNMYFTLPSFHSVMSGGEPLPRGKVGGEIRSALAARQGGGGE